MANLQEIAQWEDNVYRLETADPIVGGENGLANRQAKQLANRTAWLKRAVDSILSSDSILPNQPNLIGLPSMTFTKVTVSETGIVIKGEYATFQDIQGTIHPEQLPLATSQEVGAVKISNSLNLNDERTAASSKAIKAVNDTKLDRSGGTLTGKTEIQYDAVDDLDIMNKRSTQTLVEEVVDERVTEIQEGMLGSLGNYALLDGNNTFTGEMNIQDPTAPDHATNKDYVDNNFVPVKGNTLIDGKLSTNQTEFASRDYITKKFLDDYGVTKTALNNALAETRSNIVINQGNHGFVVGDVIRLQGSTWVKALASSVDTLGVLMVQKVIDVGSFIGTQIGKVVGLSNLAFGKYYFLSETIPGKIVINEPSSNSQPIFYATSTTEGLVLPYRPSQTGWMDISTGETAITKIQQVDSGSASFSLVVDSGYIPFFPEPNGLIGVNRTPEGTVFAASKGTGTTVRIFRLDKNEKNMFLWTHIATSPNISSIDFTLPAAYFLSGDRVVITHGAISGTVGQGGIWHSQATLLTTSTGSILVNTINSLYAIEQYSGILESSDGNFMYIMNSGNSHLMEFRLSDMVMTRQIDIMVPNEGGSCGDYIDGNVSVRISDNPDTVLVIGGHGSCPEPMQAINVGFIVNLVDGTRRLTTTNPYNQMYGTGVLYNNRYYNFTGHLFHNDPFGSLTTRCWYYDIATDTYNLLPDIPRAIKYPRSFVFNNGQRDLIVIMGGDVAIAGTFMKNPSIFFFDPATNEWAEFPNQNTGWVKHANGLIEQWGEWFPSSGDYIMNLGESDDQDVYERATVVFKIPFPNQCLNALATINYSGNVSGSNNLNVYDLTKTTMKIQYEYDNPNNILMKRSPLDDSNRMSYMWRAIGY